MIFPMRRIERPKIVLKDCFRLNCIQPLKVQKYICALYLNVLYLVMTTFLAIRHLIDLAVDKFKFQQEDIVNAFVQATRLVRLRALEEFPDDYNYWLRRLRISLGTEGKVEHDYWKSILKSKYPCTDPLA